MARDFIAEMDALLTEGRRGSDEPRAVVAQKIHARLIGKDRQLLDGWLRAKATHFLAVEMGQQERSEHSTDRRRAASRRFANAADAAETGDTGGLRTFDLKLVVDEHDNRRSVGDMTGADHLYVAGQYETRANRELMLAAFHEAVARKVGEQRTRDALTESEYDRLFRSITGQRAEAA